MLMRHLPSLWIVLGLIGVFGLAPAHADAQEASTVPMGIFHATEDIVEYSATPVLNEILKYGARLAPDDGLRRNSVTGQWEPCHFMCTPERQPFFTVVRDWLRGLMYLAILPLALISLLTTMLTTKTGLEGDLGKLVVRVLVVTIVLKYYHVWDQAIWYGVTVPVAQVMLSGDMVNELTAMASRDLDAAPPSGPVADTMREGSDVSTAINSMAAGSSQAAVMIERDPQDPRIQEVCADNAAVQDVCSRLLLATMGPNGEMLDDGTSTGACAGATSKWAAFLCWREQNRQRTRDFFSEHSPEWAKQMSGLLANTSKWLSGHVVGILLLTSRLAVTVIMWGVWLGSIFLRGISLTLAPVAIAFSLLPGGDKRMQTWFNKHAQIALAPAAFAFGFLLYYVFMIGILASNSLTGAVIGIGLQVTFPWILAILTYKMKDLLNGLANDATAVASTFGKAGLDLAVKTAMVGAAVATGGATAAATAAAGQVAGGSKGGSSTAPGTSPDLAKTQADAQTAHESMKRGTDATGTKSPLRNAFSTAGLAAGGKAVVSSTVKMAKDRARSGFTGTKYGQLFSNTHEGIAGEKPGFLMTEKEKKEHASQKDRERQEAGRSLNAHIDPDTGDFVTAHAQDLDARIEAAKKKGKVFEPLRARKHERLPRGPRPDFSKISDDPETVRMAEAIFDASEKGQLTPHMQVEVKNGVETISATEQTAQQIIQFVIRDPEFAAQYAAIGASVGAEKIRLPDGTEVHNPHQVIKRDTAFANGLMERAKEVALQEQEILKRNEISDRALKPDGSVADLMIRDMDRSVAEPSIGGDDDYDRAGYMDELSTIALKVAAARYAGDDSSSVNDIAANDKIEIPQDWERLNAFDYIKPEERSKVEAAMRTAMTQVAKAYGPDMKLPDDVPRIVHQGETFGANLYEYRRSLGTRVAIRGKEGSPLEVALPEIALNRLESPESPSAKATQIAYEQEFAKASRIVENRWKKAKRDIPEQGDEAYKEFKTEVDRIVLLPQRPAQS